MIGSWDKLVAGVINQNTRALARMITQVENRQTGWKEAMAGLYPNTGKARIVGITGSPGAGKSTLTNVLTKNLTDQGKTVGVIAVDPSSPFSGGAILGDRLRMNDIATIDGVFIRSMATRGALGGLCQGARDVARIMDAFGKDIVIIETVGVGQDEVEVVKTADMVMVVCVPGQGDGIQALKAGIMEIADVYVVNKSDTDGADQVVADIQGMLSIAHEHGQDLPPVVKTSAITGSGVPELVELIAASTNTKNKNSWKNDRIKEEVFGLLQAEIFDRLVKKMGANGDLEQALQMVADRQTDPYSLVQKMLPKIARVLQEKNERDKR